MEARAPRTAVYARVSSDRQAKDCTVLSQLAALRERLAADGLTLEDELCFVDDGYSGSTLVRPALERLRDRAYAGGLDRLYVHSPDRLSRRYAHRVLLIEELKRHGVQMIFLNHPPASGPEGELLLQVQGIIAEYERAQILERSRRGKRHAARRGCVHALGGAPYGYRYVTKQQGGGRASYQVRADEARVVRRVFEWVGREGVSLGEACRRLNREGIPTHTGKGVWGRSSVAAMLRNPAYKGSAAYGRTRVGPRQPRLRPARGQSEPGLPTSVYRTAPAEQETIPVPALVGEDLFAAVAEQLATNRVRRRERRRGASHLLQGLVVCPCCGDAYHGIGPRGGRTVYRYYRCSGNDHRDPGGERTCGNRQLHAGRPEEAVWGDVCAVLREPERAEAEFERRLKGDGPGEDAEAEQLAGLIQRVRRGIARLIDSYEDGLLEKHEFEPRIRSAKERLARLEAEAKEQASRALEQHELRLVIGHLRAFAERVERGLDEADGATRREIIRALVKRVEIGAEKVRVVYRVSSLPFDRRPCGGVFQDCPSNTRAMPEKIHPPHDGRPVP